MTFSCYKKETKKQNIVILKDGFDFIFYYQKIKTIKLNS